LPGNPDTQLSFFVALRIGCRPANMLQNSLSATTAEDTFHAVHWAHSPPPCDQLEVQASQQSAGVST
jgi:hypothetical protein